MRIFGHKNAAKSELNFIMNKNITIAINGIFPIKINKECKFNNF
jgi:hypothetical protein